MSGSQTNRTFHFVDEVGILNDVKTRSQELSSVGVYVRRYYGTLPRCLRLDKFFDESINRPRDEKSVNYAMKHLRMTNKNWLFGSSMSLLD